MATQDHINALWHAFESLDLEKNGNVPKSQLKVVTGNVCTATGVQDMRQSVEALEKQFSDSKSTLNFEEYRRFMEMELFSQSSALKLDDMYSVCWMLCSKVHMDRQNKILQDDDIYKLWMVFNRQAEPDAFPLRMDHEEVAYILEKVVIAMGRKWNEKEFEEIRRGLPLMSFWQVLHSLETRFAYGVDEACVAAAIDEIYEEIINEVVKNGFMSKKGHMMSNWKERWFVLKPGSLTYYTSRDMNVLKGTIVLDTNWKVESLPDRGSNRNRLQLSSSVQMKGDKNKYEICAPDPKSKQEWLSAVQLTLECLATGMSPQKLAFMKRREERSARRESQEEEDRLLQEEMEKRERQKRELEEERKAREEAEARVAELAALREAEEKRMAELEELYRQAQELLEQERQAKRDEEIVRALQARLLEEEMQKREELERLKSQQEELLHSERQKREEVEEERLMQIQRLEEEQRKLEELEQQRLAADEQLKQATQKLHEAEAAKEEMAATAENLEQKYLEIHKMRAQRVEEDKARVRHEKPVGLAKPIIPTAVKLTTHRGAGAFGHQEFDIITEKFKRLRELRSDFISDDQPDMEKNDKADDKPGKEEDGKEDVNDADGVADERESGIGVVESPDDTLKKASNQESLERTENADIQNNHTDERQDES
ncbi:switch-associated protein 70-like isoform X2 [Ptychodera flava]|uniref:switch-associated protein 70-like isoform X2 n=1 Tax=Ptychodera flava TaxID=63121 RepID=UPI00396A2DBA